KGINEELYHTFVTTFEEFGNRVLLVGETSLVANIHPTVLAKFEETVAIDAPSTTQRMEFLRAILRDARIQHNADLSLIAGKCHGYVLADLAALCDEAYAAAAVNSRHAGSQLPVEISTDDFLSGMASINTSDTKNKLDLDRIEEVRWRDVGGHQIVKTLLEESVVWFYKNSSAYARLGVQPSKGVLLFGPPGTGKTLLAKAVAYESGANFLPVSVSALVKGEIGESEKAVAKIFEKARKQSPCIVFLDEIESLFTSRESSGDLGRKLVLEMDLLSWETEQVVLLAATNHPENLDSSLLRPGRLDRLIAVPPPSDEERAAILKVVTSNAQCADNLDLFAVAHQTVGATGADLRELVRRAGLRAMRRAALSGCECQITQEDFQLALDESQ
ncbi:hypothetical protein HK104_009948, partial [Borealophlyctis nickersoniae]